MRNIHNQPYVSHHPPTWIDAFWAEASSRTDSSRTARSGGAAALEVRCSTLMVVGAMLVVQSTSLMIVIEGGSERERDQGWGAEVNTCDLASFCLIHKREDDVGADTDR
jgi:hypothetical protein